MKVAWRLNKSWFRTIHPVLGIGSDAGAVVLSSIQWLQILEDEDEATEAIVLVGQPGGESEEETAQYIAEAIDVPVVVVVMSKLPAG